MKKAMAFLAGFWLLSGLALAQTECTMAFEVTVHEGPSAGLILAGILNFSIDENSALTGTLTREDGPIMNSSMEMGDSSLPVTGQVNGQGVNLLFVLNEDLALAGIGTSSVDLRQCAEADDFFVLGPAVGPQAGDQGDWRGRGGRGGGGKKCVVIRDPVFGDQRICLME